ncbi:hypothetical protein M878_45210 [Streptomyces roseochromogenus subsp. oscitans DS 12.976]|uniref:Uncharacterized protein n=1 Tax=Streptomyces roseochromogenus subsp. oscitans DS 12.976 TaxID=1352936 RepID=V6JF42_STRRC|nr:hypothetical protein M878_45210 [Streptomyces roseochromogenus subsp. oscitans DS 12.976]
MITVDEAFVVELAVGGSCPAGMAVRVAVTPLGWSLLPM